MPRTKSPNSVTKALCRIAVTEKRLARNRANAVKSAGSRAPERKARSAQNASKHGFAGSTFAVVRLEELNEINDLKADAAAFYRPADGERMQAVERIASRRSKSSAACAANPASFAAALDSAVDSKGRPFTGLSRDEVEGNMPVTRTQNRNGALVQGLCRPAAPSNLWLRMRYQP